MNTKIVLSIFFIAAILVTPATITESAGEQTQLGKPVVAGQGEIWTFVTLDSLGEPEAIGVQFSEGLLSGLPAEATETTLEFPEAIAGTPFNHFVLDWNPHGHEPPGVYDAAHLDFHFYLITDEEKAAVQAGSCSSAQNASVPEPPGMVPVPCDVLVKAMQPLPPDMSPPGFQLVPAVVPNMGNHLMDISAPEFNGQPFTHTWIYGAYEGKITFFEPMVSKAFLESRPEVSAKLRMPETMPTAGWYPTEYGIHFQADQGTFSLSLEGFKWFEATQG